MTDWEFDGERIARQLPRPAGAAVAQALIGCLYYRIDPELTEVIRSCDAATATLIVRGPGDRERRVALAGGYVLTTNERLGEALNAAMTDDDLLHEQIERRLIGFGITARVERDDAPVLDAAISQIADGEIPIESDRGRIIALARKYGSERAVLKFIRHWFALVGAGTSALGDMVIALAAALRDLGEIDAALRVTDAVLAPGNGLSPSELGVLFTQRGALWLDQYDVRPDAACLAKARACAERAWAIAPSRHCSFLYQRLKKLEADQNDEASMVREADRRRAVRLAEARSRPSGSRR